MPYNLRKHIFKCEQNDLLNIKGIGAKFLNTFLKEISYWIITDSDMIIINDFKR